VRVRVKVRVRVRVRVTHGHMRRVDDVLDERRVVVWQITLVVLLVDPPLAVELGHSRHARRVGRCRLAQPHIHDALSDLDWVRCGGVLREDRLGRLELRQAGACAAAAELPPVIAALEPRRARRVGGDPAVGQRRQAVGTLVLEASDLVLVVAPEDERTLPDRGWHQRAVGHRRRKGDGIPEVEPRIARADRSRRDGAGSLLKEARRAGPAHVRTVGREQPAGEGGDGRRR